MIESTQLRNIQNIENSLALLRSKIQKLTQLDSQKEETLNQLILSTVPVVEKKIREHNSYQQLLSKKSNQADQTSVLRKRNQESRIVNEKELNRSKELVATMKVHNSLHLKQSRKENELKIKKLKELNLNDKKSRKLKVKEEEEKAQIRIQEFHEHKSRDLKMRREKESRQNQLKIQQLMQELEYLGYKQQEMEQKLKSSEENVHKFRTIIRKVDKMKCEDFNKLKQQVVSPSSKKINSRSLSEAILLYTAAGQKLN